MQYVICYDISDDRRRERCATALLDYGRRMQESVYVATLDGPLLEALAARLKKLVEPALDSVHIFPLCENCAAKLISLTEDAPPAPREFYIA